MQPSETAHHPLDVLVIGAGQAGLAIGKQLRGTGLRFHLVDGGDRVGDSWRSRFDSLVLFSPRAYSALPGLAVPGDPDACPTKDEISDYLETYARHFDLPVRLGTTVDALEQDWDGFVATTGEGASIRARAVVVATGAFQRPNVPPVANGFSEAVQQLTPVSYRNPGRVAGGTVLVVGDGATGRQIALELATTRRVLLATGRPRRLTPDRILGRSTFWWLDRLGLLRLSRESRIGRRMMAGDPFPARGLSVRNLRAAGIQVLPRLTVASGSLATFADGTSGEVAAVIWATGYRDDSAWVRIPGAADAQGRFVEHRGISPVAGLFFVGRSWQWTRGSALLYGVGEDAAFVADAIVRQVAAYAPGRNEPAGSVLPANDNRSREARQGEGAHLGIDRIA
jgi:putative flavoprotein involved in K+ transport